MTFGEQLVLLRQDQGLSLREFAALVGYDASNISKIEREVLPPPKSGLILRKWGAALGLDDNSSKMNDFVASGLSANVQRKVKSDEELTRLMPAFFRTVENRQVDPKTYKRLMDILKQNS